MVGCNAFDAAQDTLVGIEFTPMLKKRPRMVEAGDEGLTAAEPFPSLAASSSHRQGTYLVMTSCAKFATQPLFVSRRDDWRLPA